MSFKGEIPAAILAGKKTGFATGDIYRIISEGKLGNLDVQFGTFVEWNGTTWKVRDDLQLATNEEISQLIDDTSTTGTRASVEGDFVNKLIVADGKVAKITDVYDGTTTYVTTDIVDELNAMQWKDVVIPPILEAPYNIPVHNHEHAFVSYIAGSGIDLTIQCDETCDEATVFIQASPANMQSVVVKRGTTNMVIFGRSTLVGIDTTEFDEHYLYSTAGSLPPTNFSEISVSNGTPIKYVEGVKGGNASENRFAVEIKKNYAVVHYV